MEHPELDPLEEWEHPRAGSLLVALIGLVVVIVAAFVVFCLLLAPAAARLV